MNKTVIIKKIVGNALKPYGFIYKGTDIEHPNEPPKYQSKFWIFEKAEENLKKEIVITDVHIEYLTINFSVLFHSCFVSAQSRMKTIKEILPKNVYPQGHSNEWYYNSEESFTKSLEMFAQYAVDYGIDGLEQIIRIWKDSDGSVLIDNCTYYKNREKYRHY